MSKNPNALSLQPLLFFCRRDLLRVPAQPAADAGLLDRVLATEDPQRHHLGRVRVGARGARGAGRSATGARRPVSPASFIRCSWRTVLSSPPPPHPCPSPLQRLPRVLRTPSPSYPHLPFRMPRPSHRTSSVSVCRRDDDSHPPTLPFLAHSLMLRI